LAGEKGRSFTGEAEGGFEKTAYLVSVANNRPILGISKKEHQNYPFLLDTIAKSE